MNQIVKRLQHGSGGENDDDDDDDDDNDDDNGAGYRPLMTVSRSEPSTARPLGDRAACGRWRHPSGPQRNASRLS